MVGYYLKIDYIKFKHINFKQVLFLEIEYCMIALTSCDSPTWMESCSMDQLAASNTTTLPPLRATHSFGFISPSESSQVN